MLGFYIFGAPDVQQIFPILFEAAKKEQCYVGFFDCYREKRQLYNYSGDELVSFLKSTIKKFDLKMPIIKYYSHQDKQIYNKDYDSISIDTIFIGNVWCGNGPQFISPVWYPNTKKSKVIYCTGWDEAFVLHSPLSHVDYCIYKGKMTPKIFRGNDPLYPQYHNHNCKKYPGKYFGNLLKEHFNYDEPENNAKNICFIPENYIRKLHIAKPYINFCDKLIEYLHSKNFYIVWKQREKGWPLNWNSPLEFTKNQPDLIIDRDLQFPSSMFHYGYNSDICLILNTTWSYYDVKNFNSNVVVLKTPGHNIWSREPETQFSRHADVGENYSGEIIDITDSDMSKLDIYLNKNNTIKLSEQNISRRILDEVRSIDIDTELDFVVAEKLYKIKEYNW